MPHVVFLRAANVAGHQVFRPRELVAALPDLDLVNIGAAGTFVVRAKVTEKALREAYAAELPFVPELAIFRGKEVIDLFESDPFGGRAAEGIQRSITALYAKPPAGIDYPIGLPEGRNWEVRLVACVGRFVLSERRTSGGKFYPNEVAEKLLGVPATTRTWGTLEKICRAMES